MNIKEDRFELTAVGGPPSSGAYANIQAAVEDGAGYVGVASATLGTDITPGKIRAVGVADDNQPLELVSSALKLTGLGTVATPTGTLEPTWVKVTVNGVAGVVPFYPL